MLSCGRGNGATAWRSNSGRHVRPTLSGRRERPEVLRVFLQGRRSQQAVQVRRPEVQQPVQMRAKVFVHVRYRPEPWIGGMIAKHQDSVVILPSRVAFLFPFFFLKEIVLIFSRLQYLSRLSVYLKKHFV